MRAPHHLLTALLGISSLLWACPPQKPATPPDAGRAKVEAPKAPVTAPSECPKVRGQAVGTPKGAPPELQVQGSAPGVRDRPVAVLLAAAAEAKDGTAFPVGLTDELLSRELNVVEGVGLRESVEGKRDALLVRSLALRGSCEGDAARVALIASPRTGAAALEIATSTNTDERPAALVFLSGGDYTETRVKLAAHRAELETLPILFLYSDRDAAWSTRFQDEPTSPLWLFRRQGGDAHGLELLSADSETVDDIAVFLEGFLQ